MAMRALHQLRYLVNELLRHEIIDNNTKINIEMARELNDANQRKAYRSWQNERENAREMYCQKIKEIYKAETGKDIEPNEDDILKYQLWEEQYHICLYTGEQIGITGFIGANPKYDIEHTIPRSLSYDNSQENLTLSSSQLAASPLKQKRSLLPLVSEWRLTTSQKNCSIQPQSFLPATP
jgi:CRISPR-associated endonuclease Csn1